MAKQVTRYQVREFIGAGYSRQLGRRVRGRAQALRLVKHLKRAGREVYAAQISIAA